MKKDDVDKKQANAKALQKPDAELKASELDQISGGIMLAKPANPRRKKPNKVISGDGPWP